MKRMHQLAALAALTITIATGCTTPSGGGSGGGQALDCDRARQLYAAYQASLDVREPSEDEVKAARAAGTFLAAWCGWAPPTTVKLLKRDASGAVIQETPTNSNPEDRNGVPILYPPHE